MVIIFCVAPLVFSLSLATISFLRLNREKASYLAARVKFAEVDKQIKKLNICKANYSELQQDYKKDKLALSALDKLIQQYEIGIGTVDSKIFSRTTDFNQLTNLKSQLEQVKESAKMMIKKKQACLCFLGDKIRVNNSKAEATKLKNREIKLRLRCFDNEVKGAVALVDWNNINRLIERLERTFDEINKRGKIVQTQIQTKYRDLKISELKLTFEIKQLEADIKENEREERRIQRELEHEEEKIKVAVEKAKKERERMELLVQKELEKFDKATEEQRVLLAQHQQELEELKELENRAVSMAQMTRAGYVYIISNKASFGRDVVKIGMTRRLDPLERVRELGDASVPDTFDVHAIYYCDDAPALESFLHKEFSNRRVNLVNNRKEFFYIQVEEVIKAVENGEFNVKLSV